MTLSIQQISLIYVIAPILGFFILIGLSLISFLRGKKNPTNIQFTWICFIGALVNANVALVSILPDKEFALKIDRSFYFFIVFAVPLLIQFVHSFLGIENRKWITYSAYILTFLLLFFTPTDLFISGLQHYKFGTIAKAGLVFYFFAMMVLLAVGYSLFVLFDSMRRTKDNQKKNRIKYILGGIGLGALLIALNILTVYGINIYPMGNFSFIPAIFLAFGVLKYDLLDIGVLIRRGTVYFILTGIITTLYVLVIYLFNAIFIGSRSGHLFIFSFVLSVLIVLLFNPLRDKVQKFIDNLFFRGKYDYQNVLKEISREMASLLKIEPIMNLILTSISKALQVTHIDLFLYDDAKMVFRRYSPKNFVRDDTANNIFTMDHSILNVLKTIARPLGKSYIEHHLSRQVEKNHIIALFNELDVSLMVPMISNTNLVGIIALGQKKSGELFVHEDMELLMTIANQSVTALDNAKSYEEIENLNQHLERKVAERTADLRRALLEKEQTQNQLIQSESLAAIGQLVAGTAHELNNPLASASSLLQTCMESVQDWDVAAENRDEVLNDLIFSMKELKRAGDIVRSLLDLSRQTQVYVEPVSINLALDDTLRVLYNQYKHLEIEIKKQYDDALPLVVGNFANLGQVFINVIKNAIESLAAGVGIITLSTRYKRDANVAVIEIGDTGTGVPDEHLQNIFKPFFTTKPVGKGTGLGLYISYEIIRRHGGDIKVRSMEGEGTTFTIELPCRKEA